MEQILLIVMCVLLALVLIFLIILLSRKPADNSRLAEELRRTKEESEKAQSLTRQEIVNQFKAMNEISVSTISRLSANTNRDLETIRTSMDRRLGEMRADNEKRLGEIRQTVDKSLSETVSAGIQTSFDSVSTQLKQVYQSMTEMRTMTSDITDLKHILSNFKNRGTWGEVQLGALIEDVLSPSQYEAQFALGKTQERVDFAVKLPGDGETPVYLPIDSKFPMDRYQAVLDAEEYGDERAKALARDTLVRFVRDEAKKIKDKYILPPQTTDFAVLFVPSEGLYAFLASSNMVYALQKDFRILLAGPSSLSALLNSLQIGFKTLALERQSGEILELLGAIKKSFDGLTSHLEALGKNLNTAESNLNRALSGSRTIARKLRGVEDIDLFTAKKVLNDDLLIELADEVEGAKDDPAPAASSPAAPADDEE